MRYTLNHNHVLHLLKLELGDQYEQFEQRLVLQLHKDKPIWAPIIRQPGDFLCTIKDIITAESVSVSDTLKYLLSNLTFSLSISKRSSASSSSSSAKTESETDSSGSGSKSPLKPKRTQTKRPPTSERVSSKENPPSSGPSRSAMKKLRASLMNVASFHCSETGCKSCLVIKSTVPVTRCTHPNPHPSGWFVHVPRKVTREFHRTGDQTVLSVVTGSENPLSKTPLGQLSTNFPETRLVAEIAKRVSSLDRSFVRPEETESVLFQPRNMDDSTSVRSMLSPSQCSSKSEIYYPFQPVVLPDGNQGLLSKGEAARMKQRFRDRSGSRSSDRGRRPRERHGPY